MSQSPKANSASTAIVKAMGLFSGVKMVAIICSLIRNKLIAWLIGPAGLGLVIIYNSIVDLVSVASRLSVDQSALRNIAGSSRDEYPRIVGILIRWSVVLGIAGSIVMLAASPLLSLWSFGTTDRWPVFCMLAIVPFCLTMSSSLISVNQGLRRFGDAAKGSMAGAVLGLIVAVPLIIFLRVDSIEWIIIGYGLSGIVGAVIFRARLPKISLKVREVYHGGAEFIRLGVKMTIAAVAVYVANYIFVVFMNHYASTSVLGMYQAGYTIVNTYVNLILTGIWMEYYPRLAAQTHSPRRMSLSASHEMAVTMWILMPFLCAFVTFGDLAIRIIYSSAFLDVLPYITFGSIGIVLRASSWSMSYIILASGDGNTYIITEILSAAVGLGLSIAGFVLGGFIGLGLSYIAWYAFYTALIAVVCHRRYGIHIDPGVVRLTLCAISVVTAAVFAACFVSPIISGIICVISLYFSWRHRFGARNISTAK